MQTDAGAIKVKKGDRDCSSAVCEAWELALAGTAYDGLITRYNWTGGMREMFVGSGLFSWQSVTANAQRGDVYLDEENHTAMALGGGSSASCDVDALARRVIAGDYGNGDERKRRLGSYYSIVQARVNEMLS